MLAIIVKSYVKSSNLDDFIKVASTHAKLSKELDYGLIRFDIAKPIGEEVVFIEIWESYDAFDNHSNRGKTSKQVAELNLLRYDKKVEIYNILEN